VEIINIGIASNGKFIMTCCRDTTIWIWDLKGELLATLDSKQMNHTHGCVSPCGRFVASSGFTPDVKVWEVCFDKSGGFKEVTRAFELKGHSASVYWFSFNGDSRRMASVSKDGTWRLWDCNVEYQKRQDPYLLGTWRYDQSGPSQIALSPDARTVILATGANLSIYSVTMQDCQQTLEDVHIGPVVSIEFSTDSRYFVSAGDKHVNVFYNVAGYRATIVELEEKKKGAATQALRERLQEQINEATQMVKNVEAKKS
jgi:WD40 repeat protein